MRSGSVKKSYRILVFLCLIFGVTWIALTPVAAGWFRHL